MQEQKTQNVNNNAFWLLTTPWRAEAIENSSRTRAVEWIIWARRPSWRNAPSMKSKTWEKRISREQQKREAWRRYLLPCPVLFLKCLRITGEVSDHQGKFEYAECVERKKLYAHGFYHRILRAKGRDSARKRPKWESRDISVDVAANAFPKAVSTLAWWNGNGEMSCSTMPFLKRVPWGEQ